MKTEQSSDQPVKQKGIRQREITCHRALPPQPRPRPRQPVATPVNFKHMKSFGHTLIRNKTVVPKQKNPFARKRSEETTELRSVCDDTTFQSTSQLLAQDQPNRSSCNTSCLEGMSTPVPGFGRRSRRDNVNALVALHAKMQLHLLNHAAFTRFCMRSGAVSALPFAKPEELCCLSGPPPFRQQAPPVMADFGQNRFWPKPTLAKPTLANRV